MQRFCSIAKPGRHVCPCVLVAVTCGMGIDCMTVHVTMLNLRCQGRPALPLRHKGLLQFCVATIAEDFLGIVGD